MGEICSLSSDIAGKIAAGEVVERPVNVVKELLENSLDAGADHVRIDISGGGKDLIKITDNGSGVLPEDFEKIVERYATSKISSTDDLDKIKTFGFRGEALSAISTVSDFNFKSGRKGFDSHELISYYGNKSSIKPSSCLEGTIVSIRDLFRNLPARYKFLKSNASEQREIVKFVKKFILLNDNISVRFYIDNKEYFFFDKGTDLLERSKILFNEENLNYIQNHYSLFTLRGVVGLPYVQKLRSDYIVTGINKRVVKDPLIIKSIRQAYHRLIPENRYPIAVIDLSIDPSLYDVNVHPAKLFVKFLNPSDIFSFVYDSVSKYLSNLDLSDGSSMDGKYLDDSQDVVKDSICDSAVMTPYGRYNSVPGNMSEDVLGGEAAEKIGYLSKSVPSSNIEDNNNLIINGQLFETVIVCTMEDNIFFIDQHIAHERILFEDYKKKKEKGKVMTISLIEPLLLELDCETFELAMSCKKEFCRFGLEFEDFGSFTVKIVMVPLLIVSKDISKEFKDILSEVKNAKKVDLEEAVLVTMSCRHAVKAGDKLSEIEMKSIVGRLFDADNPYTCPHGRPIIYKLSKKELFNKFERH